MSTNSRRRRPIALFAAFLLASALVSPLAAFDLDSLLTKSLGGKTALDSLEALQYCQIEGKVILNGMEGRFVEYYHSPTHLLLRMEFPEFTIAQGYDGTAAWQQNINGNVSELSGYEKRELLGTIYFESGSYLLSGRVSGRREYREVKVREARRLHEVAFYPLDQDTIVAWFDPVSGQRVCLESRLDNATVVTELGDYRMTGGMLIPWYSHAYSSDLPATSEFFTQQVKVNQPFDTIIFHQPAQLARRCYYPPDSASVTVPIHLSHGHIYIEAVINGTRKVRFILDSGASATILDKTAVERLKLPDVGSVPAKGMGGIESARLVRIDSISIGPIRLLGQIGGVLDLSLIRNSDSEGEEFGGTLGYDFLSQFPILIDCRDEKLTVYRPETFQPPAGGYEIPFRLTMLVPTVTAELAGESGEFVIDLGNAHGVVLHRAFVERTGLVQRLGRSSKQERSMAGIGGSVEGRIAVADRFRLGSLTVDSLPVILTEASAGLSGSVELAGNIGNEFLQNYRVLLDYSHSNLILYDYQ